MKIHEFCLCCDVFCFYICVLFLFARHKIPRTSAVFFFLRSIYLHRETSKNDGLPHIFASKRKTSYIYAPSLARDRAIFYLLVTKKLRWFQTKYSGLSGVYLSPIVFFWHLKMLIHRCQPVHW